MENLTHMNAVAEMTKPAKAEEPPKRVKPTSFRATSDYIFARFAIILPVGWILDDVLDPDAWAHVAHILDRNKITNEPARVGTLIEVRTEDHAFYAELYVRAVRDMALDVQVLQHVPLGPKVEKKSANFDVRWNVGKRGFDVVRKSDGAIVASGLPKKEDAYAWIDKIAG